MSGRTHNLKLRHAATLLELMATLAITASLMASTMVVLRSSYTAWKSHEEELAPAFSANAVLRHLVQHARQTEAVTEISGPSVTSGSFGVLRPDGSVLRWSHSSGSVFCSLDGGTAEPVADGIDAFSLDAYEADGTTLTTITSDIHAVRCRVTVQHPIAGSRTTSSYLWMRSW